VIELAPPRVSHGEATFSWTVTPRTPLYLRTSFSLSFPPEVDLDEVPPGLWWRIALICLHAHWPLLRPCRIVLPVTLPADETEFWLRLLDSAVATLESFVDGQDTARSIEIVGSGPPLDPLTSHRGIGRGGSISCFSGGRDGITQAAMLSEIAEPPTLVTVTSPVSWSNEHDTPRRREVLQEITRRRELELIEVRSDLRGNWKNDFDVRYAVGTNEVTDTFLYLASALVVGAARGARFVMMASEAEVQENHKLRGMVVQTRHFMYSAATHQALNALLAPTGMAIGSTTNSLRQFQVQRLLAKRYADLRDLQYSCWELERDQAACSRCRECRGIALNLIASDISPAVAGIDLVELLLSHEAWLPGENLRTPRGDTELLPRQRSRVAHEMQELRCLAATPPERVAALANGDHPPGERDRALAIYRRVREDALSHELEREPGYRAGYLDLLPDELRAGVAAILDQHFSPAPAHEYAQALANTRLLTGWISAPLRQPAGPRASPPAGARAASRGRPIRPAAAIPPGPIVLDEDELASVADLIPDPEPDLVHPPGGRLLRVAETLLDGNELRYVNECVTGNWISSAGSFVPRMERAFADAVGASHAVVCSSGTAALHLALVAAGVGAGDEVIVPAFTMIATANAVRYTGAEPVFVDADPRTWNLDPGAIADKISGRTRAIIAVHTYGQPADMDALEALAADNGLLLIEDAAEAHGASHRGRPVGSIGAVSAFSLYGNKILTAGEGGVLTTGDTRIAEVARELRDHAFSRERHFWHRRLGFNYRMTNMQAAVGLAQTERLPELVARRRANAERYREQLGAIEGIGLPPQLEGGVSWVFGITVDPRAGVGRDELRRRLGARGVETRTFFVPMHLQPIYFRQFAHQRYPVAEELGRTGLYLPSGPALSDEDIGYVAAAVRDSLELGAPGGSPNSV